MSTKSLFASLLAGGLIVSTWAVAQQQVGTCGGPDQKATACTAKAASAAACDKEKGTCCQSKGAALAACHGAGADSEFVKAARAAMPKLMYRVGDKTVCCPDQASELAKSQNATVRFVVGEQSFENEGEAKQAYAKALDGYLSEITSVKYVVGDSCLACPNAAASLAKKEGKPVKFRVASFDFADEAAAKKAIEHAKSAAQKVEMKMVVGESNYSCPTEAAAAAKSGGKNVEYCIGEKRTVCRVSATVDLALARVDAAIDALAHAAQS